MIVFSEKKDRSDVNFVHGSLRNEFGVELPTVVGFMALQKVWTEEVFVG